MHRYINLPVSEISLNSLFLFDGGTCLVRQRRLLESHTHETRYLQGAYLGSIRCAARLGTFYYFGRTEGPLLCIGMQLAGSMFKSISRCFPSFSRTMLTLLLILVCEGEKAFSLPETTGICF